MQAAIETVIPSDFSERQTKNNINAVFIFF